MERGRAPRVAFGFGVLGLMFWALAPYGAADLDMFHQMALFRELLRSGAFPYSDVFAYTPTAEPVVHHEWGTGAVLYLLAVGSGLGETGIALLWYVLVIGIGLAAYVAARARGASGAACVVLAPAAVALLSPGLAAVRAQMFTFLFVALLLLLLELDRRGARSWLAVWLPIYVVWLNLHGGFVVGVGLFGLYALERLIMGRAEHGSWRRAFFDVRRLIAAGVAKVLLLLANPYGWEYVHYVWHALRLDRPLIAEWAPLWDPRVHPALPLAFVLSLVVLVYAVAGQRTRSLSGLALVLATGYLAVMHQRMVPIYGIVWFVCVAAYLTRRPLAADLGRLWRAQPTALALAILLLGSVALGRAIQLNADNVFIPTHPTELGQLFPAGAVDYLAVEGFQGNLFTAFDDGSFVSWTLHPAVLVSLDSRFEAAFSPALVHEHDDFFAGRTGWQETLDRYPTDAVLVQRSDPIALLLEQAAAQVGGFRWSRVYRDDAYDIYMRSALAAQFPTVDRSGERIVGRFP